jgi:hypothetical protein
MDLIPANCTKPPFNGVEMVSATDYAAALNVPGNFNWQRAVRTALVKTQMKVFLPLTDFMARPQTPVDPFLCLGGSSRA